MYTQPFWIAFATAGRIAIMPRPRGDDWLDDEIASLCRAKVHLLVSLLTANEAHELGLANEAAACAAQSLEYVTFPIADRGVPNDARAFATLARQLADATRAGRNVVIHCRQGVGRSSMLAATMLMELGATAEVAFDAIAAARSCAVPDTPEQRAWVATFARRSQQTLI